MPDERFEEEPVEEERPPAAEKDEDKEKDKNSDLRSGLSKRDRAPSEPRRYSPEEIEAYLKARKPKKRSP